MNCCKDTNKNNEEERSLTTGNTDNMAPLHDQNDGQAPQNGGQAPAHKHKSHLFHMALCCGLPLLILLVLPLVGYKGILQTIAPFICPVMMLVMMPMMMRGHKKSN